MKKIIAGIFLALVAAISIFFIYRKYQTSQIPFTIEWHEITPEKPIPVPDQLLTVEIEAFIPLIKPYVYATDPRVANVPSEKQAFVEQKIIEGISDSLRSTWNKKTSKIYMDLQDKRSYVAIAKDNKEKILGYSLLQENSLKNFLASRFLNITNKYQERIDSLSSTNNDEIFISLLAVVPKAQKKGVGKALIFSVFDHCPHIKKIYLTTSANDFNQGAQRFYERIGFTKVLKGTFILDEGESEFEREKIVYLFEKK